GFVCSIASSLAASATPAPAAPGRRSACQLSFSASAASRRSRARFRATSLLLSSTAVTGPPFCSPRPWRGRRRQHAHDSSRILHGAPSAAFLLRPAAAGHLLDGDAGKAYVRLALGQAPFDLANPHPL